MAQPFQVELIESYLPFHTYPDLPALACLIFTPELAQLGSRSVAIYPSLNSFQLAQVPEQFCMIAQALSTNTSALRQISFR